MVWTCFKIKLREKGFEHENKRKMCKKETEIKMGTRSQKICHTVRKNAMERNSGGGVIGRQRQMERLGCQMTHLNCKHLRKNKNKIKFSSLQSLKMF
jgi:hypothetical protein